MSDAMPERNKHQINKRRYLLLLAQNLAIEVLLDFLIRVVDAQLLKAIRVEYLKARNVENTDCANH